MMMMKTNNKTQVVERAEQRKTHHSIASINSTLHTHTYTHVIEVRVIFGNVFIMLFHTHTQKETQVVRPSEHLRLVLLYTALH